LRVSPDGTKLAANLGGEIGLIDIVSGTVTQLTYTDNLAISPDWSPNGKHLIYSRPFRDRSEPPDSAGLFVYDLMTGADLPLNESGPTTVGASPRYSPDGTTIAFSVGGQIYAANADGSTVRKVLDPPAKALCWFPGLVEHGSAILYLLYGLGNQTYLVNPDGSSPRYWPVYLGMDGDVSPDQTWAVMSGVDPTDSTKTRGVLFIRRFDDATGTTARQLTFYAPPESSVACVVGTR